jgi:hypothetical protein
MADHFSRSRGFVAACLLTNQAGTGEERRSHIKIVPTARSQAASSRNADRKFSISDFFPMVRRM